jgi:hypothetical protein
VTGADAPDEAPTERTVTLVVCDHSGAILGQLAPFSVETPWWQDMEPIHRRLAASPGLGTLLPLTVLRLLDAVPASGGHDRGGRVTYLAETRAEGGAGAGAAERAEAWAATAERAEAEAGLSPCHLALDDDPLRMPWARPGGPAADLAWAASLIAPASPPVQRRTWNLSAIWSIPTPVGTAWLKCVPPFFAHEAAVLRLLAGGGVPRLIGAEGHRILLAELPGVDGYDATLDEQLDLIDRLVELQVATARRTNELLGAGVPDARWPALIPELHALVRRRAPGDIHLSALLESAPARTAAIDDCGLPDVLVHGDAHPGNARIGTNDPIWFDWGDSRVGNPLLDLAVLEQAPIDLRPLLEEHWLKAWAQAMPGSNPARAWELLRPLAALRGSVVYQQFLDHIEASERRYHEGDVAPALAIASRLAAAATAAAGKMPA